jgi:hypothetical protein
VHGPALHSAATERPFIRTIRLKGVNDDTATLKRLFETLLTLRVTPYYLHQCEPIMGSAHYRPRGRQSGPAKLRR